MKIDLKYPVEMSFLIVHVTVSTSNRQHILNILSYEKFRPNNYRSQQSSITIFYRIEQVHRKLLAMDVYVKSIAEVKKNVVTYI